MAEPKRWNCGNCLKQWEGKPVCPHCGIDGQMEGGRFAGLIQSVAIIHFDPPHPRIKNQRAHYRACDAQVPIQQGGPGTGGTGEPSIVNCRACRATEAWKDAAGDDADELPEFHAPSDEMLNVAEKPR